MRRTVTIGHSGLKNSTFGPRKLRLGMVVIFKLCGINKCIAQDDFDYSKRKRKSTMEKTQKLA